MTPQDIFLEIQRRQKIGQCRLLDAIEYTRDNVDIADYSHLTVAQAVDMILDEYAAYLDASQNSPRQSWRKP